MKKIILLGLMSSIAAAGVWAQNAETRPITQPAASAPVDYDVYNGYFVSNKFEPKAEASFVVIKDQQEFDKVFGVAMVMGDKSHRLPAEAFKTHMVLAVIKRGKAIWSFEVQEITKDKQGAIVLHYTTQGVQARGFAEFASPLIVSIPKDIPKTNAAIVRFVENGKLVKEIGPAASASATATATATASASSPASKPAAFAVTKEAITFDPATCTRGEGTLYFALGSARLNVVGREDDQCVFGYTIEIEGGYTTYLCRAPVSGGLVWVKLDKDGSAVSTSFDLAKCKKVKSGNIFLEMKASTRSARPAGSTATTDFTD